MINSYQALKFLSQPVQIRTLMRHVVESKKHDQGFPEPVADFLQLDEDRRLKDKIERFGSKRDLQNMVRKWRALPPQLTGIPYQDEILVYHEKHAQDQIIQEIARRNGIQPKELKELLNELRNPSLELVMNPDEELKKRIQVLSQKISLDDLSLLSHGMAAIENGRANRRQGGGSFFYWENGTQPVLLFRPSPFRLGGMNHWILDLFFYSAVQLQRESNAMSQVPDLIAGGHAMLLQRMMADAVKQKKPSLARCAWQIELNTIDELVQFLIKKNNLTSHPEIRKGLDRYPFPLKNYSAYKPQPHHLGLAIFLASQEKWDSQDVLQGIFSEKQILDRLLEPFVVPDALAHIQIEDIQNDKPDTISSIGATDAINSSRVIHKKVNGNHLQIEMHSDGTFTLTHLGSDGYLGEADRACVFSVLEPGEARYAWAIDEKTLFPGKSLTLDRPLRFEVMKGEEPIFDSGQKAFMTSETTKDPLQLSHEYFSRKMAQLKSVGDEVTLRINCVNVRLTLSAEGEVEVSTQNGFLASLFNGVKTVFEAGETLKINQSRLIQIAITEDRLELHTIALLLDPENMRLEYTSHQAKFRSQSFHSGSSSFSSVGGSRRAELLRILDLKQDASWKDVKKQYKKLVRKHHPDVVGGEPDEERFKEVANAYQELKNLY